MTEQLVAISDTTGAELCVDTFGDPADPPVLLIAGIGSSMDLWDPQFCARLANGRYVIRYDHRDTGRSTGCPPGAPSYTAADLDTDPVRLLDAMGIAAAHVVGVSMGGGIAQDLAARHPERVLTLTLIATCAAGERSDPSELPPMTPALTAVFDAPPPEPAWDDRAAVIEYLLEGEKPYLGTLPGSVDRSRRTAVAMADRSRDVAASLHNHWAAPHGEPQEPFRLADIAAPTLVVHGTRDPMFPLPHGEALAAEIPGARFVPLEGMGHEPPPPEYWDLVVATITDHTGGIA
ncbi:MAG: alpha/beta fold hydrolase [Thermocrispum sp.]